jgi:tetratricopeptide (TPR) repeat protein
VSAAAPIAALLCALGAAAAQDAALPRDVLCLVDGRFVEGLPLERVDAGVRVHYENGTVLVPQALIDDCLIAAEPELLPRDDAEREKAAQGLVRFEGRWMRPERRAQLVEKRVEERRAEIAERIAHGRWADRYKETTRSFAFEYTLQPQVFERFRDAMEAYFKQFAKDWRIRLPKDPLTVCFYADAESYRRTSGAPPGAIGYFRFVEPMELDIYYDRLDPSYTEDVMFHEANHYLQKLIDPGFRVPHWPGEALAEYYGASDWDAETRSFTTGLVQEGRLAEVRSDIDKGEWMGLERLVSTDGLYEHYTWGWALIYFLMHTGHEKEFKAFFRALPSAKDVQRTPVDALGLCTVEPQEVWRAFKEYLKLEKPGVVEELEGEWHRYIDEELQVVTARGLEKAARKAVEQQRVLRAERLYREAIDKGTTNPATFHQLAELLAEKGEVDEALALWDRALALDPLNAELYAGKGRALFHRGDKEEGRRLVALAREVGLDDPWIELEIGEKKPDDGGGIQKPKAPGR